MTSDSWTVLCWLHIPTIAHNLWATFFVCIAKQYVKYLMLDQCIF